MSEPGTQSGPRPPYWARGWSAWLFPKPFTVVSSLLYLGILALFFYNGLVESLLKATHGGVSSLPSPPSTVSTPSASPSHVITTGPTTWHWNEILAVCAVLALLAVDRVEFRLFGETPPRPAAVALLALRVALIEVVAQLDQFSFSPVLYLIVPFYASMYFSIRASYWVAGLVALAYIAKLTWYQRDWYTDQVIVRDFLVFAVGLLFVMTMAKVVRNERASRARAERLLAELERSHRQLQAYSEQVAELATTRERNRLARDIHDSLGHYLTVVNVQLEKALTFRQKKPQEADQAVRDAKRLASEALQSVRHSVGTLRDSEDTFSLRAALEELVGNVQSAQLAVELRWEGSDEGYPRQTLMALYRTAQEGLTNIQKHAGAGSARVELCFGMDSASLMISDDGSGFDPGDIGATTQQAGRASGYGLQGVRERLELVGGSLRIEGGPGEGARLLVTVPKDQLYTVAAANPLVSAGGAAR
jgi:signal transduction histidine kinase